jgi:glutamate carboxypeptidase
MMTPQNIQAYLENNLPAYFDLLRRMVEVNSFTANPAGVRAVAELTAAAFAPLGFTAETIPSTNPDFGPHLVLTRPGATRPKIGLISHLDTVFPPEEEIRNNFVWREAGQRIYGPGIVDIKGGTVGIYMMLSALQHFAPAHFEQTTWLVLLDACEERGGFDFGELCRQQLSNAQAALVFEPGGLVDNRFKLVAARKGMAVYRVIIEGRAAHAGNDHALGANAIVQLAETVQRVAALTDYNRNLTFNVGIISGGTGTNRVPHQAEAMVEMRAFDIEVFEQGIADMLALTGQTTVRSVQGDYPCPVTVELIYKVPPWSPNLATDHLLEIWQATAARLGHEGVREERGGLSDGNLFWQHVPTLDGLGPAGGNMHCSERSEDGSKEQEYLERDSLVPKTLLNTMALLQLLDSDFDD